MVYINYDKRDGNKGTIHKDDCTYVRKAWSETPDQMKQVNDGYWLAVRRMVDAVEAIRDLGVNLHYGDCCNPRGA